MIQDSDEEDCKNELPKGPKLDIKRISKIHGILDEKEDVEGHFALKEEGLLEKEEEIRAWSVEDELEADTSASFSPVNDVLSEREPILLANIQYSAPREGRVPRYVLSVLLM